MCLHVLKELVTRDGRAGYKNGLTKDSNQLLYFSGAAVVTLDKAALWTDGRYFLQAEMELDCNWILQKQGKGKPSDALFKNKGKWFNITSFVFVGLPNVPTMTKWLSQVHFFDQTPNSFFFL